MVKRGRKPKTESELESEFKISETSIKTDIDKKQSEVEVDKKEQFETDIVDDYGLPPKKLFRIDEVARYFNVSERTIRLWIEHGHLNHEKIVGTIRIPRESIIQCRFNNCTKN